MQGLLGQPVQPVLTDSNVASDTGVQQSSDVSGLKLVVQSLGTKCYSALELGESQVCVCEAAADNMRMDRFDIY